MLPTVHRLSAKEFPVVLQKGVRLHTEYIDVRYKKTAEPSHMGFIIGKAVDKRSSRRNRMKRQLSENVRLILKDHDPHTDAVFMVRKALPQDHTRVTAIVGKIMETLNPHV